MMVGRGAYDLMYRLWAPWDRVGVRPQLRQLVETGELTADTHPRAVDLGCGTGANVAYLAEHGFEVTGFDFSKVALDAAHERVAAAGVADRCRLVEADLTDPDLATRLDGPYDLVVDAGTLDDLDAAGRRVLADTIGAICRPRGVLLCWCFYGARADLPWISFVGPSKVTPGLEPGEEQRLFGGGFDVTTFERDRRMAFIRLDRR